MNSLFLMLFAVVILVGALGEKITERTQIPDVIWLILLGLVLGPVAGIIDTEALRQSNTAVKFFADITLIIVLFEGGSQLQLQSIARAAPRAALLSVSGFIVTVSAVALASWLVGLVFLDAWTWAHGVMLGAIVGGSSSLIVMPSMKNAQLDERVSNLVGLESALTDALCVVVTLAMISILSADGTETSGPFITLGTQFGIALLVGTVAAWCWMPIMGLLRDSPHAYPVTLSALIVLYLSVEALGGSAALGILAFAIVVGNAASIVNRIGFGPDNPIELGTSVRDVHSNIAFIIKSLFFCFIGLMIGPPWLLVVAGVLLGFFLLLVRVPAVWLATRGANFSMRDQRIVLVSLPRGMAAGVLATIPAFAGVPETNDLPSLVFASVVTSIIIFAVGFPLVSRRDETGATPVEVPGALESPHEGAPQDGKGGKDAPRLEHDDPLNDDITPRGAAPTPPTPLNDTFTSPEAPSVPTDPVQGTLPIGSVDDVAASGDTDAESSAAEEPDVAPLVDAVAPIDSDALALPGEALKPREERGEEDV